MPSVFDSGLRPGNGAAETGACPESESVMDPVLFWVSFGSVVSGLVFTLPIGIWISEVDVRTEVGDSDAPLVEDCMELAAEDEVARSPSAPEPESEQPCSRGAV